MKILHNPRCSKSRQGLAILENSGQQFEVINYLQNQLSSQELADIINKLGIKPIALVRKNEAVWKEQFKGKDLTDNELVDILAKYPKLIERPIVIKGSKAVIGRPPETIKNLL
jgi:arsenate reductase